MAYFCSVFLGGLTAPLLGLIVLAQIAELNLPHEVLPYRPGLLVACTALACFAPGWLLGARLKLPRRFDVRYMPFTLSPLLYIPLAWGVLYSLNATTLLAAGLAVVSAMIPYGLFLLGFLAGICRREPACLRGRGLCNLGIITAAGCLLCLAPFYPLASNTLFDRHGDTGQHADIGNYFPFAEDNRLAKPDTPPSLRIAARHPRLHGVYYLLPLFGAAAQAVYAIDSDEDSLESDEMTRPASRGPHIRDVVGYSTECIAFEALLEDESDIYFGPPPSRAQLEALRARGLTPVQTPIASNALVFFVHRDNPVQNLSTEQIQSIYAGDVDDWSAVGGADAPVLAFQRHNSDIQAVMETSVMQGRPLGAPLHEEYVEEGFTFIRRIADYRNRTDSLGYDFYWNAVQRFPAGEIRFLAVDGIAPTQENITNGSYPFSLPLVMLTCRPLSPESKALRDWIISPEGQGLIAKAGYAPQQ